MTFLSFAGHYAICIFLPVSFYKVNQGYSLREVLHSMELDFLAKEPESGAGDVLRRESESGRTEGLGERAGICPHAGRSQLPREIPEGHRRQVWT